MRGRRVAERRDRQVVHPDQADAAPDQCLRPRRVRRHEGGVERRRVPEVRAARAEQQPDLSGGMSNPSTSSAVIVGPAAAASTTQAGPISASSGIVSAPPPPSRKWTGASTWVPVWTPRSIRLTLQTAPSAIDEVRSIWNLGSPVNTAMSSWSGTLTSIQSISSLHQPVTAAAAIE